MKKKLEQLEPAKFANLNFLQNVFPGDSVETTRIPLLQETLPSIKLHTYSLVSGHITREGQTRYMASRNNFNGGWIRESS